MRPPPARIAASGGEQRLVWLGLVLRVVKELRPGLALDQFALSISEGGSELAAEGVVQHGASLGPWAGLGWTQGRRS